MGDVVDGDGSFCLVLPRDRTKTSALITTDPRVVLKSTQ